MAASAGGSKGKDVKAVAGTKDWAKYAGGYLWDMSDEQRAVLDEFLRRVPRDEMELMKFAHETDESFGARILRARKYDVDAALLMLHNSAEWRREKRPRELAARPVEEILGCPPDELAHFYPHRYLNVFDVDWRPVYFEATGKIDIEGILCSTTDEALVDAHIHVTEGHNARRMAEATRQRPDGRITESTFSVLDMDGVTLGMFMGVTRKYLADVSKIDQDNYPETLGRMLLINTPGVFSFIWSVVSGFLDERTQHKIEVHGSDYQEVLNAALGGPENVPVEYGGTLRIPGGLYSSRMMVRKVPSGRVHNEDLNVKAGDRMRCRWIARPADIEFQVVFRSSKGERTVYPLQAHPTSASRTVEVAEVAPEDGTYEATWDNRKGWKERQVHILFYVPPDEAEEGEEGEGGEGLEKAEGGGGGGDAGGEGEGEAAGGGGAGQAD